MTAIAPTEPADCPIKSCKLLNGSDDTDYTKSNLAVSKVADEWVIKANT